MPIYEYICDDCGTKFEKLVRSGDPCGLPGVRRVAFEPKALNLRSTFSGGKAKDAEFPLAQEECVRRRISADGIDRLID